MTCDDDDNNNGFKRGDIVRIMNFVVDYEDFNEKGGTLTAWDKGVIINKVYEKDDHMLLLGAYRVFCFNKRKTVTRDAMYFVKVTEENADEIS